jgi:hypothetical protein
MKKNNQRISFMAFGACLLLVAALAFVFFPSGNKKETLPMAQDPFSVDNYNIMHTDTFIHLIKKKYGESAVIKESGSSLKVNITDANMKTQDFFNGNDKLLEFDLKKYGFEIKHANNSNSIAATFALRDGGVVVPNDVLINLAN